MKLSMYQASVPVFIRALGNLIGVLQKGAVHSETRKIDPAVLLGSRLFPDMFPLSRQVQIVSDTAKGAAARLAGMEPPSYTDTEQTFGELIARLEKTVDYLKTFKPEQIDGSEARTINIKVAGQPLALPGMTFLLERALPNLYFHSTTAYGILRHNGVDLGKKDYLGKHGT